MKRRWIDFVNWILLIVLVFIIIVNLLENNNELKREMASHFQSLIYKTDRLIIETKRVDLEEVAKTEQGFHIVNNYASQYSNLARDYMVQAKNDVYKLGSVLSEVAQLEATLASNGRWTPSEKEKHEKALVTLELIIRDFKSINGSDKYWYQLITKKDSPLIENIDKRIESEGLEL